MRISSDQRAISLGNCDFVMTGNNQVILPDGPEFGSLGEATAFFPGTLESFSAEEGFFFRQFESEDRWTGYLRVPIKGRIVSYSYCDGRAVAGIPDAAKDQLVFLRARFLDTTESVALMFQV